VVQRELWRELTKEEIDNLGKEDMRKVYKALAKKVYKHFVIVRSEVSGEMDVIPTESKQW